MKDNITKYRKRLSQLHTQRESWVSFWRELQEYVSPIRGKYLNGNDDDEQSANSVYAHQKIINNTATYSLGVLAAGMQGGITSPSSPWFRLRLPDERMMEVLEVREYLHAVRDCMMTIFAKSNFYSAMHSMYVELCLFGTASMLIEEDFNSVIRCRPLTCGEYYLGLDNKYRPDTLYRKFSMTARQMKREFGEENLSDRVLTALKQERVEDKFTVIHAIEPRVDYDAEKELPYASVYFEENEKEKVLRNSGYESIPFVAPRWTVRGCDAYGFSPCMEALGDVKQLQKIERDKLMGLDKTVNPPMVAPASMKRTGGSIVPGGVTYVDVMQGSQGFTPAYQVALPLQGIAVEIEAVTSRIRSTLYTDLFLALIGEHKTMTATEAAERKAEKMLMLGPVLERFNSEVLDVVIDRVFDIAQRLNVLPQIPEVLAGQEVKVEYTGLIAQAQKVSDIRNVEQLAGFVANLANVNPAVLDKVDFDEAVDQYADQIGVSPNIIRSDDVVKQLRNQRTQTQEEAVQMQQVLEVVKGAKLLADTPVDNNSALDALVGGNNE